MILSRALLLLALSALDAVAFIPNSRNDASFQLQTCRPRTSLSASSWFGPIRTPKPPAAKPPLEELDTVGDDGDDLSIPYDAAARLAYDDWRAQYNKGDFDAERFVSFKSNYDAVAVANVIAKRKARESGEAAPALLSLNEFADYTAEEYQAKQSSSGGSSTAGDVLGKAYEAAQSQSEASNALAEAAQALAEEEELLARQLGLESVDELEVALDSMEGIAADGGELETENIAREARIRSAYLEWCKEYGKEPVESRFSTFASNFLAMENYARESGREMSLNTYADCSEEEYLELTGQKQKEVRIEEEESVKPDAKVDEDASKADAEALAQAEAKAEAERKAKEEELAKKRAAQEAWEAMSEDERKAAAEKEREERRAAQIKALEQLRKENEAAAIAAAKAEQEREAAQIAARREIDRQAAEIVRQKAREFEAKQKELEKAKRKEAPPPPKKKKAFDPLSLFASSFAPPKPVEKKVEEPPAFDVSSLLGALTPTPPPAPKIQVEKPTPLVSIFTPPVTKKETKPAKKETSDSFSFFTQFKAPEKVEKPAPKPATKAPATKAPQVTKAPAKSEGFSFFAATPPKSTTAKKPLPQKSAPAPAPAPPVVKPSPVVAKPSPFSFFAAPPPKPAPKVVPPVEPKVTAVSAPKDAFSFFGGFSSPKPATPPAPAPAKQAVRPAAAKKVSLSTPAPAPRGTFSIFSSKADPAPKVAPSPPPAPVVKKEPFSFFGAPKPAVSKAPAPKVVASPPVTPPKKESFSFFGAPKPAAAVKPAPAPPKQPEPKKAKKIVTPPKETAAERQIRGTISLTQLAKDEAKQSSSPFSFFAPKTEPNDDIPVLSRWIQNDDGSITGLVTNSKSFRSNTRITTSPVRKGVKKGQVVKTSSGSQYRLN